MIKQLNSWEKLKILGEGSKFDVCGFPSIFTKKKKKFQRFGFIYPAVGRKGSCVNLFKVLQSNACEGNCFYCANRKDRNFSRIEFSPQELAKLNAVIDAGFNGYISIPKKLIDNSDRDF